MEKGGFDAADRVQVMAYDHDGPHSTFANARADVDRMVWEVGQDTTDDSSLLRAIREAVAK